MIVLEVDVSELHSDFFKKVLLWIFTFLVNRTTKLIGHYSLHFIFRIAQLTEKVMAPHSSALAWKIPWMEEPGGLQSMGS